MHVARERMSYSFAVSIWLFTNAECGLVLALWTFAAPSSTFRACMQAYAASYFVIPLIIWVIIQGRNRNIQQRNEVRQATASALLRPDRRLRAKLESAQKQGESTFISDKDIVYDSNKDFTDQGALENGKQVWKV